MKLKYCRLEGESGHDAGRRLLKELYLEQTGQALPPIAVAPGGKPYLENSPWHFSISHTGRHAFCLLARENVAIDAEEADRQISPRLAEKILSPEERLRWESAPDPRQALLRLWVLKEAAAKLSGRGLRGYPNHTNFSPEDRRIQVIDGCLVAIFRESDCEQENRHAL